MACDRNHLLHCLLHEFDGGHSAAEACRNICNRHGEGVISTKPARAGSPALRQVTAVWKMTRGLVKADHTTNTEDVARMLGRGHITVDRHIRELGSAANVTSETDG